MIKLLLPNQQIHVQNKKQNKCEKHSKLLKANQINDIVLNSWYEPSCQTALNSLFLEVQ